MGKIFYIMGKSSSGKDTIFQEIQKKEELGLKNIVLYTTRPIRSNETDGVEYHFVDEGTLEQLLGEGKVIEIRAYNTIQGVWKYFTVDDENINLDKNNYLAIGTLVSYEKLKEYYGAHRLVPVYIEVSDQHRIERALKREKKQEIPNIQEMCRRFLADCQDFSEDNLKNAGILKRFDNNGDREICIKEIEMYIESEK